MSGSLAGRPRVVCVGELLVDMCAVDVDVPLHAVSSFVRAPGGAPANVAVGTARLGCDSAFVGAVGLDFFGQFLVDLLDNEGVDTSHVVRSDKARTTLAFIANHADGHKDIEFYRHPGADMYLSASDIDSAYIGGFDVVHFGSISLLDTGPRQATHRARDIGRVSGALVCYDINWRPALWPNRIEARRQIKAAMQGVTVVKMSDEDWEGIFEAENFLETAQDFFENGVELVVRTEGAEGARFATRQHSGSVPAFRLDTVDVLGAGDAFMSALIYGLLQHRLQGKRPVDLSRIEIEHMVDYANAAAAVSTRVKGGMPSLPTHRDVQAFLNSSKSRVRA